jgi:peptidoglycan/LPS O-acetylase OafA/YrhL
MLELDGRMALVRYTEMCLMLDASDRRMYSSDQGRLLPLDSLRAIAALAVLLYHYTKGYEEIVGPHISPVPAVALGYLGVELFFVISGYVIAWTLQRSASLADFAFGRIARLYPAYLACAAVTGVVIFGFGFNPANIQTGDIAWNSVIGLPPLVNANNLDASYWSLGVEVSFYVMAAAFTYGLPKLRIEIFCIVWLGASFAARARFPEAIQFQLLLASGYSPLFVSGAMLFVLSRTKRPDWLACATFAAALVMCLIGANPHWIRPEKAGLCLFIALVYAAASGRTGLLLNFGPLVILGQASYSLYLIHQIVGYWIIANLEGLGIPPLIAIAAAVCVAISLALSLRSWVEVPVQRFLRRAARTHIAGNVRVDVPESNKGESSVEKTPAS